MPATKSARKSAGTRVSSPNKKTAKPDFAPVFAALRQMLEGFVGGEVAVQIDKPGNYHIEITSILHRRKPLYFAGVRTGKNYVSFHLLAAYYGMGELKGMSPALKKRMQGKACFNFTAVDQDCFAELSRLAVAGLKKFKSEEFRRMIQKMQ
jgi:hypothetical protein